MDLDELLINIFEFLKFSDLLNCLKVSLRWKNLVEYVIKSNKNLKFKWEITDYHLSLNKNAKKIDKKFVPVYHHDMILLKDEGILINMDDHNDRYFVEFYSQFGTRIRFDLFDEDNPRMFPQQSYPHFLKEDNLVVFHLGYHDEGSDEIEYYRDIVFDVRDWSKITWSFQEVSNLPNKGGKCGLCLKYAQKTKVLPVGTRHTVCGYGRNRFSTPLILLNNCETTRIVESLRPDFLNVYENDIPIRAIPRPEESSLQVIDENYVAFFYWYPNDVNFVDVTTGKTFTIKTDLFKNSPLFYSTEGITFCRISYGNNETDRTWKKVSIVNEKIEIDNQSFEGYLPVYIKKENKLLFF